MKNAVNAIIGTIFLLLSSHVLYGGAGDFAVFNGDQDVTLFNDEFTQTNLSPLSGDFNGDGRTDLALPLSGEIVLLLGPHDQWGHSSALKTLIGARIVTPPLPDPVGFNSNRLVDWIVADINKDGKDDFLFLLTKTIFHYLGGGFEYVSEIDVILGRDPFPQTFDLTQTSPDLRILGKKILVNFGTNMAVGDVNGDGVPDLVSDVWSPPNVQILYGPFTYTPTLIDLNVSTPNVTIIGPTSPDPIDDTVVADVNGDNRSDIILSRSRATPFGTRASAGEIDVLWGSPTLPTSWNLTTLAPNAKILGDRPADKLKCSQAGEATGDQKADLLVNIGTYAVTAATLLLPGSSIVGGTLDLRPGSTASIVATSLPLYSSMLPGDLDGDGRRDLKGAVTLTFFLTSQREEGAVFPGTETLTVTSYGSLSGFGVGDLNEDGKSDLVLPGSVAGPSPGGAFYSAFYLFYGYRPLDHPSLEIQLREEGSRRVNAALHANGEPTEMMFSGDIIDDDKNRWVPYQSSAHLTLTPTQGGKTVGVKFRNRYQRESELVQQSLSLNVSDTRMTVVTNRVGNGKKATFDFRLNSPAHVRARIYDNQGREVRELINEDAPAGLMTVEWDGASAGGQRVSPGVYFLTAEIGGEVTRKNVLVQ